MPDTVRSIRRNLDLVQRERGGASRPYFETMQPIILTSDKTMWALRPQAYLFTRYWPAASFVIGGYSHPPFKLPPRFEFVSLGAFADYPVERWTNGLIKFLRSLADDLILFLLDDYWLFREVDNKAIEELTRFMAARENIARCCVCTDRLYAPGITDYARWGHLDIIKSDSKSPYHFSFQASLWRRTALLDLLVPNETPWDAEQRGDQRLREAPYIVIGTRQAPLRYTIAVQRGQFTPDGGYQTPTAAMNQYDLRYILEQGWIPEHV